MRARKRIYENWFCLLVLNISIHHFYISFPILVMISIDIVSTFMKITLCFVFIFWIDKKLFKQIMEYCVGCVYLYVIECLECSERKKNGILSRFMMHNVENWKFNYHCYPLSTCYSLEFHSKWRVPSAYGRQTICYIHWVLGGISIFI